MNHNNKLSTVKKYKFMLNSRMSKPNCIGGQNRTEQSRVELIKVEQCRTEHIREEHNRAEQSRT